MDFQSSKCQPHGWCLGENDSVSQTNFNFIDDGTLDDDQLHTFLLEAESILNSRPLTPITTDADGSEPLTPNHLLKLCPTGNFPPSLPSDENCCPRRRWKHVQYLADQFWRRWSREYLKTMLFYSWTIRFLVRNGVLAKL